MQHLFFSILPLPGLMHVHVSPPTTVFNGLLFRAPSELTCWHLIIDLKDKTAASGFSLQMTRREAATCAPPLLMHSTPTSFNSLAHGHSMRALKQDMQNVIMILINLFLATRLLMVLPSLLNSPRMIRYSILTFLPEYCSIQRIHGLVFQPATSTSPIRRL